MQRIDLDLQGAAPDGSVARSARGGALLLSRDSLSFASGLEIWNYNASSRQQFRPVGPHHRTIFLGTTSVSRDNAPRDCVCTPSAWHCGVHRLRPAGCRLCIVHNAPLGPMLHMQKGDQYCECADHALGRCELGRAADQRLCSTRNREVDSSHIVAGVDDHRAPSGYKPDVTAGHGACPMQLPGRCTTQSCCSAVEAPTNPLPAVRPDETFG
jgi:hypothetical protein